MNNFQTMPLMQTLGRLTIFGFIFGASLVHAQTSYQPLQLEFAPPAIEPVQICIPREPDVVTEARWITWDGESLPAGEYALIKRDINRLLQIDARRWLPTIELMIARLSEADPGYAGRNALLARIKAMEAAGAFEELKRQQLVSELLSQQQDLSPRMKNALSGYLNDGIGIERDPDKSLELLVSAGFAGNADALLTLTKMDLEGDAPTDWSVPPELAVSMAFGALVGELNSSICDRASRIAREFHSGDVVEKNSQLAHDWFRFAADLGDPNAAWKVVEYHLLAENFEKQNDILLHYLKQASDAGLPYAQIELGRVYEIGALVPRDLEQSLALFRSAAATGERPGLTRVALFLETYQEEFPDIQEERFQALEKLSQLPDAPGWVFTRLAQQVLTVKGRWAGQREARALLEQAAELGDLDGSIEFAKMLIASRSGDIDFERAVSLLTYSTATLGGVTPTKLLHGAFMCQALDSPRMNEAAFWLDAEQATDTSNIDISAKTLTALQPRDDALTIATLQSHALYGRPRAMASYLVYLDHAENATPDVKAFWSEYADQYSKVLEALAKLELELAVDLEGQSAALGLLRKQHQKFGSSAALSLARGILSFDQDNEFSVAEVVELLSQPAGQGEGAAMRLLAALQSDAEAGQRVFREFADVIEANGDYEALIFAAPFVDKTTRDEYLSRAAGIIPCDYKNVMAMSRVLLELGETDQALHWMSIASQLLEGNAWSMVDLAETHLATQGVEAAPLALTLFEQARALGDKNAERGLFQLLIDHDAPTLDIDRATEMIRAAAAETDKTSLNIFLGKYRRADEAIQGQIEARLEMPQIYLTAAKSGDIFSMRSYGAYLQENAKTTTDLADSTDWLKRAAEGGDITAMAEYGYALAFGIGVPADLNQAEHWLSIAETKGSRKAADIVRLIRLDRGNL